MALPRSSLLLATFLALAAVCQAQAPAQHDDSISGTWSTGTWFGSFTHTNPDGKVSHETAVLVVRHAGSNFSGSLGPTIDQQTPWTDGSIQDNHLRFHLNTAGGLNVTLALRSGSLTGTAIGQRIKAQLDLKPAPGLLPHQQLVEEITKADQDIFDAFDHCNVARFATFLSKDLEFYHDHTGKTDYEENLQMLKNRCAEGIQLRRQLEPDSLIVNAVPGFGAIEAGTHHFYSRDKDGREHLDATALFTEVWSKSTGTWKLVRVISYDHH